VRVVDDERERALLGEVRRQPVQRMLDREGRLGASGQRLGVRQLDVEQRGRVARRAGEARRRVAVAVDGGLQELADDPGASTASARPRPAAACSAPALIADSSALRSSSSSMAKRESTSR
jgi:hypothetical protein